MTKNIEISIPVAMPPWTALGKRLESLCRKALHKFALIDESDKKIGIALSGGKDSLTQLFLLKQIAGRGFPDFEIIAFHVAGEFSCGASVSKGYTQAICDKIGVKLVVLESNLKLEQLECYSCSRIRRKLLFDAAKEHGVNKIAFGHHRDDIIQTLLMNLLQKAQFEAMLPKVPMVKYGITIIRPLIYIEEKDIREFAKLYQFARISCQCPVGQKSKRKSAELALQALEEQFSFSRENLFNAALQYGDTKALREYNASI